jgi:[methyl-Co(III) methanol/glycine betaine-specific corrinoid protein]:coenzyme M methyltransferase
MSNGRNSKEAILKLLRGEKIDYVPNFSGMGSITLYGIKQLGYRFNQVHVEPRMMADAAASTHKYFGFESAVVPFDMGVEAEALGSYVKYYEKEGDQIIYPSMAHKVIDRIDVQVPEGLPENEVKTYVQKEIERRIEEYQLQIPDDLAHQKRIPVVIEAIRLLKQEVGDRIPVGAWVLGPFTELGQIMDLEMLLKLAAKKPALVNRHLDAMVEYLARVIALYEEAGADYITVREMGATSSIMSPRMFKSLVLPHLQQLFPRLRVPSVLHICGDTNSIVEMMAQSGASALSIDQTNRLGETRQKLPNTVLLGNYKAYGDPFCEGEPRAVAELAKKAIEEGADALWPGCDIWPVVPEENMKALIEATWKYGDKIAQSATSQIENPTA